MATIIDPNTHCFQQLADADDSERDDDDEEWKTVASTKQQHMLEHNFPVVSYLGSFDDSLSFELAKGHLKIGSYGGIKDVAIGDVAANFTEKVEMTRHLRSPRSLQR